MNGMWGLWMSAFISSTLAPGGSEVVLGYMVAGHQYPVEQLVAVATCGNTLGAMTTWGLGYLASKKIQSANLLSSKKQKALQVLANKGQWVLLFSWLPVVGDVLCFASGWLRLPLGLGVLLILIGKLLRYSFVAWMTI